MAINEFELDLDVYKPKPGIVTLGGKKYHAYPPKFKNLVTLISTISEFQRTDMGAKKSIAKVEAQMQVIKKALIPLMPALAEPDVDLEMDQLIRLVNFVVSMAAPQDTEKLRQAGITFEPSGEKKSSPNAQIS